MWNNQIQKKLLSLMSNSQAYYFKLDFQKVDQHTGGKWFSYTIFFSRQVWHSIKWIILIFLTTPLRGSIITNGSFQIKI